MFASDLHLSAERPDKIALFERFLERVAAAAESLYVLGDLFEIWLGDDDDSEPHPAVVRTMRTFTDSGVAMFVMSGNRDFLIGDRFASTTGATLLPDWHVIDLFGTRTLLTHGDLLCTRDVQYQAFRKYVREAANQEAFLAHPLDERRLIAAGTRNGTKASMLEKEAFIMDVEQATVEQKMNEFEVTRLIHGHTHRPAHHTFVANGIRRERIVLGDWYGDCSVLVCTDAGVHRMSATDFLGTPDSAARA